MLAGYRALQWDWFFFARDALMDRNTSMPSEMTRRASRALWCRSKAKHMGTARSDPGYAFKFRVLTPIAFTHGFASEPGRRQSRGVRLYIAPRQVDLGGSE